MTCWWVVPLMVRSFDLIAFVTRPMHIPDSALSPSISLTAAVAMLPVWATASRRLRDTLSTRQTPLLAVSAAFCFTIMMFNVPAPGGTTVHPIGGGLMAVLLGPWAAVIGMTVALAVQALFFGDGGVLALGANCFVMAFALPLSAYAVYRLAVGKQPSTARSAFSAALGAYAGLNIAALVAAVILGIQPALAHDLHGHALYFPFDLRVTIPAILLAHLTIAGAAEAAITATAITWLLRSGIPLHAASLPPNASRVSWRWRRVWAGMLLAVALSPLGLLATGEAWGEWGAAETSKRVGYTPQRMAAAEEHGWKGFNLLPDYLSDRGAGGYLFAALAGALLVSVSTLVAVRFRRRGLSQETNSVPLTPTVAAGEVPLWLQMAGSHEVQDADVRRAGKSRTAYVEQTMEVLTAAIHETLRDERIQRRHGFLQQTDPRVKIASCLLLVLAGIVCHSWAALLGLYALGVGAAWRSRVPVGLLVRRTWTAVALFAGAVALPAALNIVTPGPEVATLWRSPHLAITSPGIAVAFILLLKTATSVSLVMLLGLTTPWQELLRGLRALRVPRLFLVVLTMTYRYIIVLAESAAESFTARRSRTVGTTAPGSEHGFLGGAIGGLFGKSLALTEEVHGAMLCRGWDGDARTAAPARIRAADLIFLSCGTALATAIWLLGGRL